MPHVKRSVLRSYITTNSRQDELRNIKDGRAFYSGIMFLSSSGGAR
jgi:hypothetical protein